MAAPGQEDVAGERNGLPFYEENPSMPKRGTLRTGRRNVQIAGTGGDMVIMNPTTGELLGNASAAYITHEEVDQTRFVKLYLDGIKQMVGLSKTGLLVFELVFAQMQSTPNDDRIVLNMHTAKKAGIPERTFRRGVRDMLEKKLMFASPSEGLFFINIQFMFNGDRLHFIKSYHLKRTIKQKPDQITLDLAADGTTSLDRSGGCE